MRTTLSVAVLLGFIQSVSGQGFVNLDFEDANVSGYSPGSGGVPIADAFPGWSASYSDQYMGTVEASSVSYDAISLGGAVISINDDLGVPYSFGVIDGNYSAYLFGGVGGSATLSQTGLVPIGTKSLIVSAQSRFWGSLLVVSVNGQPISESQYSTYDISSFAGKTVTLSFTELAPMAVPPSLVILDDIEFSPSAVPEPSISSIMVVCMFSLGWWLRRPSQSPGQRLLAIAVPLSRFTSRVGGGSVFSSG